MTNIILKSDKNGIINFELIDKRTYNNITNKDTLSWFRRLGGSETAQRTYTCQGYLVYKLISRSPDRSIKHVREFSFLSFDSYKQESEFNNLVKGLDNEGKFLVKRFKRSLGFKELKQYINKRIS